MILKTHRRSLVLVRRVFDSKHRTEPVIRTLPQKPPFGLAEPVDQPFLRATPESQGVSSDLLADLVCALHQDASLDQHSIMILRNGKVIAEGSFGAYDQRLWHVTHSACKSITGLAVGMLIDEGKLHLDDRIVQIFEKRAPRISLLTHKNMTVRHLLTMSSGIIFNEFGSITEKDWVRSFLDSSLISEPGKRFFYNSMNTYLLSAIVREVSGQGLMEYLQERLWIPLGIRKIFWETCPEGIEKGGWGLYIRPEDLAKVGQLVLQKGRWKDRQLISEQWIQEATSVQMTTSAKMGGFDYGYQTWVGHSQDAFLFNGIFGQSVVGYPRTGILVVSNAGDDELIQQNNYFRILNQYFSSGVNPGITDAGGLPENPDAFQRLQTALEHLRQDKPAMIFKRLTGREISAAGRPGTQEIHGGSFPQSDVSCLCQALDGRTYLVDPSDATAVGLMPLLTQVIQNNYTRGLKSISFALRDGVFHVIVTETDECYGLPVGFDAALTADLVFHGEPYRVAVAGRLTTDEDNTPVLKLRISFLEIANTRILKIFFHDDLIVTRWTEFPGKPCLTAGLAFIRKELKSYPMLDNLVTKADNDFVRYKIGKAMEPEVTARLIKNDTPVDLQAGRRDDGEDNLHTRLSQHRKERQKY